MKYSMISSNWQFHPISEQIKEAWEAKKSTRINLKEMGLAYDANETVRIPNVKRNMLEDAKRKAVESDDSTDHESEDMDMSSEKNYIAEALEAEFI